MYQDRMADGRSPYGEWISDRRGRLHIIQTILSRREI